MRQKQCPLGHVRSLSERGRKKSTVTFVRAGRTSDWASAGVHGPLAGILMDGFDGNDYQQQIALSTHGGMKMCFYRPR